jgi:hypothetical protein
MTTSHAPHPGDQSSEPPRIATPDDVRARLAYLFRASLQEGRLHPLFHLIQQYRLEEHS